MRAAEIAGRSYRVHEPDATTTYRPCPGHELHASCPCGYGVHLYPFGWAHVNLPMHGHRPEPRRIRCSCGKPATVTTTRLQP